MAAGLPQPTPTLAAWTAAVPITGTSLTTYTVPKPVITDCTVPPLSLAVTVSWSAASTPYPLTYQAVVVETGQVLTVTGSGSTRSATYTTARQGTIGARHRVRITAALPSTSSWSSTAAEQIVNLAVLLFPSCGASS